jgi:hypothetical protein
MAAPSISWKRGQTFTAVGPYVPGAGDPADLAGVTITAEVIDRALRRWPLTAIIGNDNLTVTLYAEADKTSQWDVGTASIDLRCVFEGIVFASSTMRFIIEPEVTLAPING